MSKCSCLPRTPHLLVWWHFWRVQFFFCVSRLIFSNPPSCFAVCGLGAAGGRSPPWFEHCLAAPSFLEGRLFEPEYPPTNAMYLCRVCYGTHGTLAYFRHERNLPCSQACCGGLLRLVAMRSWLSFVGGGGGGGGGCGLINAFVCVVSGHEE